MDRTLVVVTVLALVAPAVAGCLGGSSSGGPSADAGNASETTAQAGTSDATGPNVTGDVHEEATGWVRDYWGDETERDLVDASGQVVTGVSTADPQTCFFVCSGAFFPADEDRFVAPGADRVNVTVSWSAPPTAPSIRMELFHQTAAGGDAEERVVGNGETVSLPVGPDDHDAPFQARSLWWFYVFPAADPAGSIPPTEVQLTAVVERTGPVPPVPPAPDPWGGDDRGPLVENVTQSTRLTSSDPILSQGQPACMVGPCLGVWEARNGSLVPEDASRIRAVLTWTWPGPSRPMLTYGSPAGAGDATLVEDGSSRRVFEIEVTPEGADSPWQQRSLWIFGLRVETQGLAAGAASGDLTLSAAAVR